MSLPPIMLYPGGRLRPPIPPLPAITFIGSPNFNSGRPHGPPIAIVVHTMDGFLAGTDSTFQVTGPKPVSAHYGISLTGKIHQYVDLGDVAFANGIRDNGNRWFGPAGVNPNDITVSIETEDNNAAAPVSDALFDATLALSAEICRRFPSIRFLTSHHVISPHNKPDCCGTRWTTSGRLARIAERLGLELRI